MGKVMLTVAVLLLVAAGSAGAVARNVIHVRSGDRIIVNNNLSCYVGTNDIVCGGQSSAKVSADVRSSGQIVVEINPDPHGAYAGLFVDRATCSSAGSCHLVLRKP